MKRHEDSHDPRCFQNPPCRFVLSDCPLEPPSSEPGQHTPICRRCGSSRESANVPCKRAQHRRRPCSVSPAMHHHVGERQRGRQWLGTAAAPAWTNHELRHHRQQKHRALGVDNLVIRPRRSMQRRLHPAGICTAAVGRAGARHAQCPATPDTPRPATDDGKRGARTPPPARPDPSDKQPVGPDAPHQAQDGDIAARESLVHAGVRGDRARPGEMLMAQDAVEPAARPRLHRPGGDAPQARRGGQLLQRRDALFDRRVGRKQLAQAARDAHGLHGLGQLAGGRPPRRASALIMGCLRPM